MALRESTTMEEAQEHLIAMNDLVIGGRAVVPISVRAFFTAVSHRLQKENLAFEGPFVGYFWNIQNWALAEGVEAR